MIKKLFTLFFCFLFAGIAYGQTRTISGTAGWRMISIPKAGATVSDISDDTAIQGVTGGSNAADAANIYFNTGSGGTGGWSVPTNMNTAWGDGFGVIVYFYNNTTAGSSELPLDLDVSGSEPGADVKVTITNDFTLIGNPFQSNINIDDIDGNATGAGLLFGGVKSSVKVWSNTSGSYLSNNLGSGLVLSEWQGFFIEKASGLLTDLTEVTIPTSSKTATAADIEQYSKTRAFDTRSMDLYLKGEGYNDLSTKFYFTPYSSEEEDQFDGSKLNPINGSPNIAFVQDFGEGNERLSQDARALNPETIQYYEVDLNDMGVSGEFTISWPNWKNIPEDWSIILTDKDLGVEVDLRMDSSYTFTVDSKQKRPTRSVLEMPQVKAKSNGEAARFGITISPGTTVGIDDELSKVEGFELQQNYPNPFNPTTTISYSVGQTGPVTLTVYNVMGQKVAELVNATKTAGSDYQVTWDATAQASGIYYYRLATPGQVLTRQMTLIK